MVMRRRRQWRKELNACFGRVIYRPLRGGKDVARGRASAPIPFRGKDRPPGGDRRLSGVNPLRAHTGQSFRILLECYFDTARPMMMMMQAPMKPAIR